MFRKISYCLLLNLFIVSLFAQHSHGNRGGKKMPAVCEIKGTVVDSTTGFPIEYASISVLDHDGDIITGGVSDADGFFRIREINPGHYDVKIEFMGFKAYQIEEVELSIRGERSKDLGKISLTSVFIQLDAVNVVEDKPIFEFEADKMVYNSSDDIVAGSGTAEDVLNKVPMITVDQDGQVSLRGNPNVKILINGRPNRSGGDVDNIPASIIEKVEVITSPSAKYDPEGMAGIVNIVLTKGRFEGLNGSIKINAKHNKHNSVGDMNGFTFYSNYQTDDYNVYSSYSLNNRMRTQEGFRRVYSVDSEGDITYDYDYDFLSDSDIFGQSFKIGTDYSLTKTLNLNAEVIYKNHYKTKTNTQKYLWEGPINYVVVNGARKIEQSSEGEDEDNSHSEIFLELLKSFENPDKEMSLSFAYDYGKDFEYESSGEDTTDIDEIEGSYEIDFNYKLPINENSKFEFGYDGRFNDSQEDMDFSLSGVVDTDVPWRYTGINDFDYSRSIHGFFAEYQLDLNEKISVKPSFRIEYVEKNITFIKTLKPDCSNINELNCNFGDPQSIYALILDEPFEPTKIKETNYFPDFHFTYNLTEKKSIQFGVSKRIERPGGGHGGAWGQLRPFPRNIYNESFVMIGNPNLKPEFSTQYEISYKSPMPMGFYYTNLYYRNVTDPIEWFNDKDFDTESSGTGNAVTFVNADSGIDYGLEFFFMVMGQTFGGGYNINELKDASGDFQLNGKNEHLNMYMRVNLPEEYIKFFSYEFGFYYMKMKQPGGTLFGDKGTLWANTGISKSLFNDKLSLSFSINNIFDMGGFQMDYSEPIGGGISEKTEIEVSRGGRAFSLSLKYNFGKMQEEKQNGRGKGSGGGMDMGY